MPLLLSGANPVDSVMTQRWGRRTKLDGELTQAETKFSAKPVVTRTLSTLSAAPSRTSLFPQLTELKPTQSQPNASTKVGTFRGRVASVLLIGLVLALQPAMGAEVWSKEQPDHVIFKYKLCQPVSQSNLMMMMGSHFDDTKMAPDMATARKMFGTGSGDTEGFQGDEPRIDYEEDSNGAGDEDKLWNVDENVWVDEREENVQNNGVKKEKLNAEFVESRTWLPRRKVLNRHVDNKVINNKQSRDSKDDHNSDEHAGKQPTHSDSYPFMRRRRRRSHGDSETRSHATDENLKDRGRSEDTGDSVHNKEDDNNDDGDTDAKDTKATNSIQLQLFLSGKDKKQRKKLKQKLRQSPVNLSKSPPWECQFSQRQRRMNNGVFPQWVLEGRCETDKCFYRLYNCAPIKYTLKLLQRDPTKCNPLPSVTNITVYEEKWQLVQKYVTVGCNCVSPIVKNAKPRSRRLD